MNKFICIATILLLTACNQSAMMGESQLDYNTSSNVKNRVGPSGELISPPDCPNWKASPYNTSENAKQGNFGCATVTNLGLMLVDPRDLERGSSGGFVPRDAQRSSDIIRNYHNEYSNPLALPPQTPMSIVTQ